MNLFHRIDDAHAIVRQKGGVYKQLDVYQRGDRVYLKAQGGFVRVERRFGETWGTTSPSLTVLEMSQDVPGFFVGDDLRPPRWTGRPALRAAQ